MNSHEEQTEARRDAELAVFASHALYEDQVVPQVHQHEEHLCRGHRGQKALLLADISPVMVGVAMFVAINQ